MGNVSRNMNQNNDTWWRFARLGRTSADAGRTAAAHATPQSSSQRSSFDWDGRIFARRHSALLAA